MAIDVQHKERAERTVLPGRKYRHYKGKLYLVLNIVKHTETLEDMVLYVPLYDDKTFHLSVRPLAMFLETVTVDGETMPRFALVEE